MDDQIDLIDKNEEQGQGAGGRGKFKLLPFELNKKKKEVKGAGAVFGWRDGKWKERARERWRDRREGERKTVFCLR